MTTPEACEAVRELQTASEALRQALARDDADAAGRALEEREHHLARIAEALATIGPPDATLAAMLEEARRSDAEILALARGLLGATRDELEQVRGARAVARSLTPEDVPARFVDKRV